MKTLVQSNPAQITTSILGSRKLTNHIIKPLKSGFLGFTTIMMIIFFINLISYMIGSNEKFGLDVLDLLLAGVGFFLQMTSTLLKSFIR
jgi:hypothetical protein